MSGKTTINYSMHGIADLDVSKVKTAVENVRKNMHSLTLPANLEKNFASVFAELNSEISQFESNSKKAQNGSDWSKVIKSGTKILGLYQEMESHIRSLGALTDKEMEKMFPPSVKNNIQKANDALAAYNKTVKQNAAEVEKQNKEIAKLQKNIQSKQQKKTAEQNKTVVAKDAYKKLEEETLSAGEAASKAKAEYEQLKQQAEQLGSTLKNKNKSSKYRDLVKQTKEAEIAFNEANQKALTLENTLNNTTTTTNQQKAITNADKAIADYNTQITVAQQRIIEFGDADKAALTNLFAELGQIEGVDLTGVSQDIDGVNKVITQIPTDALTKLKNNISNVQDVFESTKTPINQFGQELRKSEQAIDSFTSTQKQVESLRDNFLNFFSLSNGWMLLKRGIKAAYDSIKDLDDAMTEIAVVSDYTLDQIWAMRDGYEQAASKMGASTLDLVNATKLYVQQGLTLQEAQEVGIETTKMARIANLDGAEATNLMTAALRGFNLEMTEANRVNDVYSELAAKSAADTEEIAVALSKTASIAANAGASFENTSAFLTQIIETTREAPETAGTALKTIIARFQELKKAPGEIEAVDGEMVDANKIETALKSAGVSLRDANGEFRNFDDVIIELASKWNDLDVMTQRYIATMAAGSRQQSRFIALMADSERLMELTNYAANSAGASNEQFNKTLDSLTAKINQLQNAWSLFLQGLADNQMVKLAIDLVTKLLDAINHISGVLPGFASSILQILLSFGAFKGARFIITKLFNKFKLIASKEGDDTGEEYGKGFKAGLKKSLKGTERVLETIGKAFEKDTWMKVETTPYKANLEVLKNYHSAIQGVEKANIKLAAAQATGSITTDELMAAQAKIAAVEALRDEAAIALIGNETDYLALQKLGLTQDQMDIALSNEKFRANLLELTSIEGLTEEEKKQIIARAFADKQTKTGILATTQHALAILFSANALEKNTDGTYKNIIAQKLHEKAIKGSTSAQWMLNAAAYAFPVMWIIAAIAAIALLATGLIALSNHVSGIETAKIDKLKESISQLGDSANKAQEKISEISEAQDSLAEMNDAFANLTKGTKEWNEQLIKSNNQVLELISKYPELADYMESDRGRLTIKQEGFDKLIEAQQNAVTTSRIAQTYAQSELQSLELNISYEDALIGNMTEGTERVLDKLNIEQNSPIYDYAKFSAETTDSIIEFPMNFAEWADSDDWLANVMFGGTKFILQDVLGFESFEESAERIYNGGLTFEESAEIQAKMAEKGIFVADGLDENDTAKIEEIFNELGLNQSVDAFISRANALGESFDELSIEALKVTQAQEAQRDSALEQLAVSGNINLSDNYEQIIGIADITYDNVEDLIQEKMDNIDAGEGSDARVKYANLMELNLDEVNKQLKDGVISEDTLKRALATDEINKEIIAQMKKTEAIFAKMDNSTNKLTEDQKKSDSLFRGLLSNEGLGISMEEAVALKDSEFAQTEEGINALLEEMYGAGVTLESLGLTFKQFQGNVKNAQDALDNVWKESGTLGTEDAIVKQIDQLDNLELTLGQTQKLVNAFNDIAIRGGSIEDFGAALDQLTEGLNAEQIESVGNLLAQTDWYNTDSIDSLKKALIDLGVNVDNQVFEQIVEATKAVKKFDLSTLKEQISSTMEFLKDIRDREADEIVFEEEEYQKIIAKDPTLKEDFYFNGLDYTYIGDGLNRLEDVLLDIHTAILNQGLESAQEAVIYGERWEKLLAENYNAQNEINKVLDSSVKAEDLNSNTMKIILDQLGINYEDNANNEMLREQVKTAYDSYYGENGKTFEINQANLTTLQDNYAEAILGGYEKGWQLIANSSNIEAQKKALESQNKLTKGAGILYNNFTKTKQNPYKEDAEEAARYDNQLIALANDLQSVYVEQDKLVQVLSDSEDAFKAEGTAEYYAALTDIKNVLQETYGSDIITDEFINTNKGFFKQMSQGGQSAVTAWNNVEDAIKNARLQLLSGFLINEKQVAAFNDITLTINDNNVEEKLAAITTLFSNAGISAAQAAEYTVAYANALGYVANVSNTKQVSMTLDKAISQGYSYTYDANTSNTRGTAYVMATVPTAPSVTTYKIDDTGFSNSLKKIGDSSDDSWEEDYDWLYNLEKQIAKTLRKRNQLESEYDLLVTKGNLSRKELIDSMREQQAIEAKQLEQYKSEEKDRLREAAALEKEFKDVAKYVWWNDDERRVEINEEKMRKDAPNISKELGERIDKAVENFERIQTELEDIEDNTADILNQQAEFTRELLDQYVGLEERLTEAIVTLREKEIKVFEDFNETISNANSELLDKIQTGIDDSRQAREDEEALTNIEEMERRLALMRSDTSGANALDILSLEDELEQARQDFVDNKIDQAIEQLSRDNDLAQKQRERQIELMNQQLEYDQENGVIAAQVNEILSSFIGSGNSKTIEQMLKTTDNWKGLATQQRLDWADDLILALTEGSEGWYRKYNTSALMEEGKLKKNNTITFTDKNGNEVTGKLQKDGSVLANNKLYSNIYKDPSGNYQQSQEGTIKKQATKTDNPVSSTTESKQPDGKEITETVKKGVAAAIWNNAVGWGWGNDPDRTSRLTKVFGANAQKDIKAYVDKGPNYFKDYTNHKDYSYSAMSGITWKKYKQGGLADFTGPAWLDGTKAHPEYVLNASQTESFLSLVNMLDNLDGNSISGGNNYYDIRIEVDELSNDYDTQQMMEKVRSMIVDDASYRNVNAIDLGRR